MAFASPLGPPALPAGCARSWEGPLAPALGGAEAGAEAGRHRSFAFVPLARCKGDYVVEAREFPTRHNARATTYMSYAGLRHGHRGGPARDLNERLPSRARAYGALPDGIMPDVPLLTLELACEALARRLDGALHAMAAPLPSHLAVAPDGDDALTAPRASFLARLRAGPRRGFATIWREPGPPLLYRPDPLTADGVRAASVRVRCALDAEDVLDQGLPPARERFRAGLRTFEANFLRAAGPHPHRA